MKDNPIRVLVVDDSAFMRGVLGRILETSPQIKVVGQAANGAQALELVSRLNPDVITLDIEMPVLDGFSVLQAIMSRFPKPVIVLSGITTDGTETTVRALEEGAVDFVAKPTRGGNLGLLKEQLLPKVVAASKISPAKLASHHRLPQQADRQAGSIGITTDDASPTEIVAIGTSTGGPAALSRIIPYLPTGLPAALVIVQHMPVGFTRALAARLNEVSPLRVQEAAAGEVVDAGKVLIAPAGKQMQLEAKGEKVRVRLGEVPPIPTLFKPSVDVLMLSVAEVYGPKSMGVILTGMGSDGAKGLKAIKEKGGFTVAQDESSCIVFGMPKAAIEVQAVDKVVPLQEIKDEILSRIGKLRQ